MSPTKLKEAAQVMLAAAEGKALQSCDIGKNNWVNVNWVPRWDWSSTDYRIKPEPREWWLGFDTQGRASVFFIEPLANSLQPGECVIKVREVIT